VKEPRNRSVFDEVIGMPTFWRRTFTTNRNRQILPSQGWLGGRWCSGIGVGHVIERSRVRFPAGALPGNLGQLSLPSLRGRQIEYQLTGWVKAGRVRLCRVAGNTV